MTADGTVGLLEVDASTGAGVELDLLTAEDIRVDASTGAVIEVTASESVAADASTGAIVHVSGDPDRLLAQSSSGGSVRARQ